jgi:predicted nucleic acid-binding Zn ribbon protein
MATYVYETVPRHAGEAPERFEVVQSMNDAPLVSHPETGRPVRRVIMGGFGLMGVGGKTPASTASTAAPCAPGCACHRGSLIPQP